ncbi:MAG: aminotransferase class V-fold PLP-dependent enzyme, partial [Flavisolibacter sp.]
KEFRLPHVSNISFKYVDSESLMMGINKDIAVSTGSACTSASLDPSHVLKAMGIVDDTAKSSIRFSLGRNTTEEEINYVIEKITNTVNKLRKMSPFWEESNLKQ